MATFPSRYSVVGKIGEGGQAQVFHARRRADSQGPSSAPTDVAVKVYEKRPKNLTGALNEDLQLEIDYLQKFQHPCIVQLFEVAHTATHMFLVQEMLEGGEIFEHLLSRGPCTEPAAQDVVAQLVLALRYLHNLGVSHRDIKAENLVFVRRGSPRIKLIDFGCADTWLPEHGLTGIIGTPQYMAPEVVVGWYGCGGKEPTLEPYTPACDIWSSGILLYELLSFTMPCHGPDAKGVIEAVGTMAQKWPDGLLFEPKSTWARISPDAHDLIRRLLTADVERRANLTEIAAHPWLVPALAHWSKKLQLAPPQPETVKQIRATLPKRDSAMLSLDTPTGSPMDRVVVLDDGSSGGAADKDKGKRAGLLRRVVSGGKSPSARSSSPALVGFGPEAQASARERRTKAVREKALHQLALRAKGSRASSTGLRARSATRRRCRRRGACSCYPTARTRSAGMTCRRRCSNSWRRCASLSPARRRCKAASSTSSAASGVGEASLVDLSSEQGSGGVVDPTEASMQIVVLKQKEIERLNERCSSLAQEVQKAQRKDASVKQRHDAEVASLADAVQKANDRAEKAEARVRQLEAYISTLGGGHAVPPPAPEAAPPVVMPEPLLPSLQPSPPSPMGGGVMHSAATARAPSLNFAEFEAFFTTRPSSPVGGGDAGGTQLQQPHNWWDAPPSPSLISFGP